VISHTPPPILMFACSPIASSSPSTPILYHIADVTRSVLGSLTWSISRHHLGQQSHLHSIRTHCAGPCGWTSHTLQIFSALSLFVFLLSSPFLYSTIHCMYVTHSLLHHYQDVSSMSTMADAPLPCSNHSDFIHTCSPRNLIIS